MVTETDPKVMSQVTQAVQDVDEPIIVSPNTLPVLLASAGRIIAILVAGFAVVMKLFEARDIMGVWLWMQTTEGAGFVAALVGVGTFALSLRKTWIKHKKIIVLAAVAPNDFGQVKGAQNEDPSS